MKLKGLSLAAVLIAIVVIGIISLFFGKFYVLMAQTYDQISVRSEIQRNMRKVAAYIVPEVWEASPATSAGFAFLEPTSIAPTNTYTAHNFLITSVNNLTNSSIQPFLVFGSGTGSRSYRLHFESSGTATSGKWWDIYCWRSEGLSQGWLDGNVYWSAMNNTAAALIGGNTQAACQQVVGEFPASVVVNTTDFSAGYNNHSGLQIVNEASLGGGLTYEMHLLGDTNNYTTAIGAIMNTSGVDIAKLKPYLDASWVQDQINNNTALGQKLK